MIMICNVPDEVVKNVRMGTWCGSSVLEKMITNGIPLEQIRAEIVELWQNEPCAIEGGCLDEILEIIDKYKGENNL